MIKYKTKQKEFHVQVIKAVLQIKVLKSTHIKTIKFDKWHELELMIKGNEIYILLDKNLIVDKLKIDGFAQAKGA